MIRDDVDRWSAYFSQFAVHTLRRMATQFGVDFRPGTRQRMLAARLARVHAQGDRLREMAEALGADGRLALRLALDGGDGGLHGESLESELRRLNVSRRPALIEGLLERGLLLLDLSGRSLWQAADAGLLPGGFRNWSLFVHPAVRDSVRDLPVPGETEHWEGIRAPVAAPTLAHRTDFRTVTETLRRVGEIIERFPTPYTRQGRLRAALRRHLAAERFPPQGSLPFELWLAVAEGCGLAVRDKSSQRWTRSPTSAFLATAPHFVLANLPHTASRLCWPPRPLTPSTWEAWHQLPRAVRGGSLHGHGSELVDLVLGEWLLASRTFLVPGVWFGDDEVEPLLRRHARRWGQEVSNSSWVERAVLLPDLLDRAAGLVAQLFDVLCHLGLVDRGGDGNRRVSRVTPFGSSIALTAAHLTSGEPSSLPPVPGLVGALRWADDDTLVPDLSEDAERVELALGMLAWRTPADTFRFDAESLARAMYAGASAQMIEGRLRELVPAADPPPAVLDALRGTVAHYQPISLSGDVCALEIAGLTDEERETLAARGVPTVDELVLVAEEDAEPLCRLLGVEISHVHDYADPPPATASVEADGTLVVGPAGRRDFRLLEALDALGLTLGDDGTTHFGVAKLPDADDLPERLLRRRIDQAIEHLEPHLTGDVSPATRLLLLAETGLVDAPVVSDRVVLSFPQGVAFGLRDAGTLGAEAELIPGGRFLVPPDALPIVEERLSAAGIPFPAHRSSLLAHVAAQDAVNQLQAAVAELNEVTGERTPGATPDPPRASAKEGTGNGRRTDRRAGRREQRHEITEAETGVRAVLAGWSTDPGDRGPRLGELAELTGLGRKELRPALRRLVRSGAVVLSGHARGARYRLRG